MNTKIFFAIPLVGIALAGCTSTTTDSSFLEASWVRDGSILAEHLIKDNQLTNDVSCRINTNYGGNDTDYICQDNETGVCYFVWHTGPDNAGTVRGKVDDIC